MSVTAEPRLRPYEKHVGPKAHPTATDLGRRTTELALRCRDNPGDREAWTELHAAVRRLIGYRAHLAARRNPSRGYDEDDLEQAAWKGVRSAVRKYDASRGEFGTYMDPWVRQAIQRERYAMASTVRVPVHEHAAGRAGRPAIGPGEDGWDLVRLVPDGSPAPPDEAAAREDRDWLRASLARIARTDPRAAEVVRRKHGLDGGPGETFAEIGASLGVTRTMIQHVEAGAIDRLTAMAQYRGKRRCG